MLKTEKRWSNIEIVGDDKIKQTPTTIDNCK